MTAPQSHPTIATVNDSPSPSVESPMVRLQKFPAAGAAPYIPVRHYRAHHGIAPPVTIRNAIPVFSAPPLPRPSQTSQVRRPPPLGVAPPVCVRQAVPAFAAPPVRVEDPPVSKTPIARPPSVVTQMDGTMSADQDKLQEAVPVSAPPPVQVEESPVSKAPIAPTASTMSCIDVTRNAVQDILLDAVPVLAVPGARVEEPPVTKALIDSQDKSLVQIEEKWSTVQDKPEDYAIIEELKALRM
ncbi:unnamed protein product [Ilex paraguariensis]